MIDERSAVSYPDADQADDGRIFLIYDRDRKGAREILVAKFTEADVAAGKLVDPRSALRLLVNRASKDYSSAEYDDRPLQQKAWNGNRFVTSNFPITAQLKTLIKEDVGSFRLEQFHHWDSDPRSRDAAIQSYELWIKMYPGHSQMATARSKLQQLRNPSR
jgi:hypothetical protein